MQEPLDALESRITELRRAIRSALAAHEQDRVRELRAELRRTERSWDALVTPPDRPEEDRQGLASLLPAREQVHQALTLLGVPAAPKLIGAVHSAFFTGQLTASRLASLRRDEERSYRAAPGARPYYLCPALTSDLLSPARALLCVSTWPLEQRITGPLSPRADFLTAAIRTAEAARALSGTGPASMHGGAAAAALRHEHPRRRTSSSRRQRGRRDDRRSSTRGAGHPRRPGPRRPGAGRAPRPAPAQ